MQFKVLASVAENRCAEATQKFLCDMHDKYTSHKSDGCVVCQRTQSLDINPAAGLDSFMVKMMEMTEKNQLLAKTDDYGTARPVGVLNTVVRVDLICCHLVRYSLSCWFAYFCCSCGRRLTW